MKQAWTKMMLPIEKIENNLTIGHINSSVSSY